MVLIDDRLNKRYRETTMAHWVFERQATKKLKVRDVYHMLWHQLPQNRHQRSFKARIAAGEMKANLKWLWKSPSSRTRRLDLILTPNSVWESKRSGSGSIQSMTKRIQSNTGVRPHEDSTIGESAVLNQPVCQRNDLSKRRENDDLQQTSLNILK